MVTREIKYPEGRELSSSDVSEQAERVEDAVNAGRRVRKKRIFTNVSYLGEIYLVWIVIMSLHCFRRLA